MQNLSPSNILKLIAAINDFFNKSEALINSTQATYNANKRSLSKEYSLQLSNLDNYYNQKKISVKEKVTTTIGDAKILFSEIDRLDQKLSSIDKYYEKTKKNKEELLANEISREYADTIDYFEAFSKIKERFILLTKKYSNKLPIFIDGINYFFSSQRKKEYEELIILKNTIISFINEIEKNLSAILNEEFYKIENDCANDKKTLAKEYSEKLMFLDNEYRNTMYNISNKIYDELNIILPDELIFRMAKLISMYKHDTSNVNIKQVVSNGILNINFLGYDTDLFIKSKVLSAVIKEKCSELLVNGTIMFPLVTSIDFDPVWMIVQKDEQFESVGTTLIHSIMFSFLSLLPVTKIRYAIIDPENRGNSIAPFFEARKKISELFDKKIFVTKEDIFSKISKINEFIEDVTLDKLGTQYENIFEYSQVKFNCVPEVELLVIFDFPKGFDERTLAELRNVLRNGSKCGLYTVIFQNSYFVEDNYSRNYEQNLKSIQDLSNVIEQDNEMLSFYSLPLTYCLMPEKIDFIKFFNKYLLMYEGIKNQGIAFSPLIKNLIDASSEKEINAQINSLMTLKSQYKDKFLVTPDLDLKFPSNIMIGTIVYPSSIFSDSLGYQKLLNCFKITENRLENGTYLELPFNFDLKKSFNLFCCYSETNREKILEFTHHIILTLLTFIPLTKVNICVFDSKQRGNSIMPFLGFRQCYPEIFDEKLYTNQDAINLKLKKINDRLDEFIAEKLGNKYEDFLDYNLKTPSRTEAINLLLIYDFPNMMDDRCIDMLSNILRNGNRCGIFVIICYDSSIKLSHYRDIDEQLSQLKKFCTMIDYKEDRYKLLPYNLQINIPSKRSNEIMNDFFNEYLKKSELIKKQGISFNEIIGEKLFSKKSDEFLNIPVGIGDGDSIIGMIIGEGSSHHALIAGATGSGKSTLLHTIIMSSMLNYSPSELHLYLMDFKSGTEFKVYESKRLPHIQLLALDAMQEFGESILEDLVKEMARRAKAFKEAGTTKIKDYIKITGNLMPRILVIMD